MPANIDSRPWRAANRADAGAHSSIAHTPRVPRNININILEQHQQLVEHILRPLPRRNLNWIWCARKSNMPLSLSPSVSVLSLSLSVTRHTGIASDRIRKRHVWHICSVKASPNSICQKINSNGRWENESPERPCPCFPCCRYLHTCRMRNFDLIDFVEQLLFALLLNKLLPKLLMHEGRVFF